MAEMRIAVCDRCGDEASKRMNATTKPMAFQRVTLHGHHDRTIDLCEVCKVSFEDWFGRNGSKLIG